jgi:hypothetical protein
MQESTHQQREEAVKRLLANAGEAQNKAVLRAFGIIGTG